MQFIVVCFILCLYLRIDSDDCSSLEEVPVIMSADADGYATDESDYLVPPRRWKRKGIWRCLPECLHDVKCRYIIRVCAQCAGI